MMRIKRYSVEDIQVIAGRSIFFDANILIYLYWPLSPDEENTKNYSKIYHHLFNNKFNCYIDFIVISEFINRAIRFEYDKYLRINHLTKKNIPFKSYRKKNQNEIDEICGIVKNIILNNFLIIGKIFSKEEIVQFLNFDGLDINDKAIISICKENGFVLLTHDSDFCDADIDILSANRKLLI